MKKNILLGVVATAGVTLSLSLNSTTSQAATIQTPIAGTSYVQKGKTYEIKVRALKGSLKGNWSNIKTTTVTVDPAR